LGFTERTRAFGFICGTAKMHIDGGPIQHEFSTLVVSGISIRICNILAFEQLLRSSRFFYVVKTEKGPQNGARC
jgi:hypothetical protein